LAKSRNKSLVLLGTLETGELATPSPWGLFSGPDGREVVKVSRAKPDLPDPTVIYFG
jgi:hypothetical protein